MRKTNLNMSNLNLIRHVSNHSFWFSSSFILNELEHTVLMLPKFGVVYFQ